MPARFPDTWETARRLWAVQIVYCGVPSTFERLMNMLGLCVFVFKPMQLETGSYAQRTLERKIQRRNYRVCLGAKHVNKVFVYTKRNVDA